MTLNKSIEELRKGSNNAVIFIIECNVQLSEGVKNAEDSEVKCAEEEISYRKRCLKYENKLHGLEKKLGYF